MARVTINHDAAKSILQSKEVLDFMEDIANEIVNHTGAPNDYAVERWEGVNRGRVSIWTDTNAARLNEATNHTLLEALGQVQ